MPFLVVKYLTTALMVVIVSEVARRSGKLGALFGALPLVAVLAMIWMCVEKQSSDRIADYAYYTFWYVIPTLPMFLILPWLLHRQINFWVALGLCVLLTILCFMGTSWVAKRFGVSLLP